MTTETKLKTISVPPDGGWGWVICLAYGLSNIVCIPIIQSFGLLFKDKCKLIGLSATDITIITNTNAAFGMTMGLVNGTLLKKYGYRKISVIGGVLISGGMVITSFANNFTHFFISYGIITSLGFGLTMASYSLALNSFFQKRRGLATGMAMTMTGLGPIVIPLLISYLLDEYSNEGAVLLIAGLSLHSFVAASLLQPLKWHMKKEITDQELVDLGNKGTGGLTELLLNGDADELNKDKTNRIKKISKDDLTDSKLAIDHDVDTQSIYGFETPLPTRKLSQSSSVFDAGSHRKRTFSRSVSQPEKTIWKSTQSIHSVISLKSVNEEVPMNDEKDDYKSISEEKPGVIEVNSDNDEERKVEQQSSSCFARLVLLCDLDLLKDPIYLNLMIGMSLAVWAEINFSLLTPFILHDFQLNTHQIAQLMSTIAATDIVFRFCAPFISDCLRAPPKLMYMMSLILLILSRSALIFVTGYWDMIAVAIFLGVAKGFRTVFMSLLIPNYVPIEKLASASGIQMVVNGIIIIFGGPLLGVIRDVTGSYNTCIIVINSITCITLSMWTLEYIYRFCLYLLKVDKTSSFQDFFIFITVNTCFIISYDPFEQYWIVLDFIWTFLSNAHSAQFLDEIH
ncbi:uncharacterized protein CBL_01999 [Carabus blaptoides fortunei]